MLIRTVNRYCYRALACPKPTSPISGPTAGQDVTRERERRDDEHAEGKRHKDANAYREQVALQDTRQEQPAIQNAEDQDERPRHEQGAQSSSDAQFGAIRRVHHTTILVPVPTRCAPG